MLCMEFSSLCLIIFALGAIDSRYENQHYTFLNFIYLQLDGASSSLTCFLSHDMESWMLHPGIPGNYKRYCKQQHSICDKDVSFTPYLGLFMYNIYLHPILGYAACIEVHLHRNDLCLFKSVPNAPSYRHRLTI